MNKKRDYEQGLADDIMNQFIQEVTKAPERIGAGPEYSKVKAKIEIKRINTKEESYNGQAQNYSSASPNLKGKWKERYESASTKEIEGNMQKGKETRESIIDMEDNSSDILAERLQITKTASFAEPKHIPTEVIKVTDTGFYQSSDNKKKVVSGNKWEVRKQNSSSNTPQVQKKSTVAIDNGKQMISPQIIKKELEKGGNANQILKRAVKSMEVEDPDLALKAQEFFFEKIGVALLNNFKKNLVRCGYCGRNFDSSNLTITPDALKKHEPICSRTCPLPSKK